MKKNFIYLGIILCVGLLEVACEKQEQSGIVFL